MLIRDSLVPSPACLVRFLGAPRHPRPGQLARPCCLCEQSGEPNMPREGGPWGQLAGRACVWIRATYLAQLLLWIPSTFQDEVKGTPGPQGQASRPHRVQPTPCASPTSSFLSLLGKITGHADCLTGSSPRGPLPAPLHLELVTHRALPGAWTCICADDSLQAPLMPEQVN